MPNFVISKYNYFFNNDIIVTSEDGEFPKENIARHSRSFVWKSNGYYYLPPSINKIDFNEGAGNLVATVTGGELSALSLANYIKSALESAGTNTYTVSYSTTTGKWTISTSGATLSLLWNTGPNKANSIAGIIGFDDSADDTGSTSYTGDYIASHTMERIAVDLGNTSTPINTFGMFFDVLKDVQLTTSAVVTLKGTNAETVAGWATPGISQSITIDYTYKNAFHRFSSDQTYRYWGIEISDTQNPNLCVEVDSAWIGLDLDISQPPEIGFNDTLIDQSMKNDNEYGYEYWDEYPLRNQLQLGWKLLSETDKDKLRSMFRDVGNHNPVLLAIDTDESIFSNVNQLLMYGRIIDKFQAKQSFLSYFDYEMGLLEVI